MNTTNTHHKINHKESSDELPFIEVYGAKAHNLKEISVKIPRNQLVTITGVSGSGKSSLAFDTIYAEGQRRYIESFSAYARQFLGNLERPDVDKIEGLSPVISIEQKTTGRNPRSTVGTTTELYDYLRLLFARAGDAYSYLSGKKMVKFTTEQIINTVEKDFKDEKIAILSPLVRSRKGHYRELFEQIRKQGFLKVRIDGEIQEIVPKMQVDRYKIHDIEVVIDRLSVNKKNNTRLLKAIQSALKIGNGLMYINKWGKEDVRPFSNQLMDIETGLAYEEPSPNTFSFNSPYGACPHCKGLGEVYDVDEKLLIPDETLSVKKGGIASFGIEREVGIFTAIKSVFRSHKASLASPISKLPKDLIQALIHGTSSLDKKYNTEFEGAIALIKRAYDESYSDNIRKWALEFMNLSDCPECEGTRLKKESLFYKIADTNIATLARMNLKELNNWLENVEDKLSKRQKAIGKEVLKEIKARLGFLLDVGLTYLELNRPVRTLSGGEAQRIRLATQIGAKLTGVTYILDEPSIGLHQRDNQRLINALRTLVEVGNSVLVVEHDKDIMLASDYIIDIGPGAGINGGNIVSEGTPKSFLKQNSTTAKYLKNKLKIEIPEERRKGNGNFITLKGATGNNLKNVTLKLPLGQFCCVTGVSGSGKSSLINSTLYPILRKHFHRSKANALPYKSIDGLEHIDKVIEIDQSPIGRTPRSNPATYIGVFTDIRNVFANLPESKIRGYKTGRFSFNVKAGRCGECEGAGKRTIEMNFLPDVDVPCEHCQGKRYNRETLDILFKGKSISDVLGMAVDKAVDFFEAVPNIYRKLKTLQDVGLGYINLGQSSTTLSGGEAQRVKIADELSKKATGKTLFILDEPTTGLHFQDIAKLLEVLNKLVNKGNTVLVIEHNLDVVKVSDYIIDIGPEGGNEGGKIIAQGTPEKIIKSKVSLTGQFLKLEM